MIRFWKKPLGKQLTATGVQGLVRDEIRAALLDFLSMPYSERVLKAIDAMRERHDRLPKTIEDLMPQYRHIAHRLDEISALIAKPAAKRKRPEKAKGKVR